MDAKGGAFILNWLDVVKSVLHLHSGFFELLLNNGDQIAQLLLSGSTCPSRPDTIWL